MCVVTRKQDFLEILKRKLQNFSKRFFPRYYDRLQHSPFFKWFDAVKYDIIHSNDIIIIVIIIRGTQGVNTIFLQNYRKV